MVPTRLFFCNEIWNNIAIPNSYLLGREPWELSITNKIVADKRKITRKRERARERESIYLGSSSLATVNFY